MYTELFEKAGLTPNQALVYERLLETGPTKASRITYEMPIKRGIIYKALEELEEKGLLTKELGKHNYASVYTPASPTRLKELSESHLREVRSNDLALEGIIPDLMSDYNRVTGAPGIRFFEGKEGIEKALEDSLRAEGIISTYVDVELLVTHIPDINERYVKKRERLGKEKRALLPDSPFAREYMQTYHKFITDTRLIESKAPPFQALMEIYDDKIAYATFENDRMLGVIVQDQAIHDMHQYLFDALWKTSIPIEKFKDAQKTTL